MLAVDRDPSEVEAASKKRLNDPSVNPMEVKRELARNVVQLFFNEEIAEKAEVHFNKVVGKGIPDEIPVYELDSEDLIVNVIFSSGLLKSKGEARRMIKQGAVRLDDKKIDDIQASISPGDEQILKVGKKTVLEGHLMKNMLGADLCSSP